MSWIHGYYRESIEIALDEQGVTLTEGQIKYLTDAVVGSRDFESMASGDCCVPDPDGPSAVERALREQQQRYDEELKLKDAEILTYRQSVARRRNVPVEDVFAADGTVFYGRG